MGIPEVPKPTTPFDIVNRFTTFGGIPTVKPASFSFAHRTPYDPYVKLIIATTKSQPFYFASKIDYVQKLYAQNLFYVESHRSIYILIPSTLLLIIFHLIFTRF